MLQDALPKVLLAAAHERSVAGNRRLIVAVPAHQPNLASHASGWFGAAIFVVPASGGSSAWSRRRSFASLKSFQHTAKVPMSTIYGKYGPAHAWLGKLAFAVAKPCVQASIRSKSRA